MAAGAVHVTAIGNRCVFRAKGVGTADAHGLQRVLDLSSQGDRLTELNQAAQCPFAVRCGGVDQNACHWTVLLSDRPAIEALSHAGGGVAAFEDDLAHEGMRDRMNQDESDARKPGLWRILPTQPSLFLVSFQKFPLQRLDRRLILPLLKRRLLQAQE